MGDARDQASPDELHPSIRVGLGAGEAERRFAAHRYLVGVPASCAEVSDVAHFGWIAAVEHFLYHLIIVGSIVARLRVFKLIPVIPEYLLECLFGNVRGGRHEAPVGCCLELPLSVKDGGGLRFSNSQT